MTGFTAVSPFLTVSFCFSKVTVWSFVALTVTATCAVAVPQLSVTAAVPVFTAVSVTEQLPVEASTEAGTVTTVVSDDWTASTSPLAAPVSVTDREAVFALSASISMEEGSAVIAVTPNSTVIWTLPSVCVFPSSVTIAVMVAEPTFSALIVELSITLTISVWSLVSVTPVTAFPSASVTLTVVVLPTFSVVFPAVTETVPSTAKTAGTMAMTSVSTTNRLRSFANVRFIPVHLFLRRDPPLLL